ncbi:hypothetical protein COX97_03770 [Candidatus Pacearchaeota archaeon CG_4_10_14_0_2_um_filter_05_32_18]|nr:MAG: hypothetical protein COX97_03770 [Candidatus Pacearchaeota archaeon CG_4_10_14_0_2_um_filter_05_32_18]
MSAQASAGPVPGYPNTNPQGKKAPPPVTTIPVATEATDTSSNNNLPDVLRFADLEKNSGSLEGKLIYSPDGKENLVFQGIETKDGQKLAKFLKTDGTYTYINQNNLDQAGGINLKGATSPTALSGGTGKLAKILGVESPVTGNLIQGVQWAAIAYLVVPFIGEMLGLEEPTTKALQYGVSSGLFAYNAAQALGFSETGLAQSSVGSWIGGHAAIFGVGVGVVVFALSYKKVEYKRVDFICDPWQAPIGGDDCEKCNDGMNPCSEYRCKSLGQACGIVNKGTEDEKCVWLNPRDVNSPIIRAWDDALKVESVNKISCDYTNLAQRPPGGGTEIECKETRNNCLPAFTPFEFGVQTNKPAQCKIDFKLTEGYEEMAYYFGESNLFDYNHTQRLNIPNKRAIEALVQSQNDSLDETTGIFIENNNQYDLYVRCTSANGYYNPDPYVVSFCVDDGPDATPPQIVETSIRNNQPVQFEVDEVPIIVYTNEPATCKWSRTDQQYDKMENEMQCAKSIADMEANMLYPCKGTLTGLEDRKDNKYYFRCEDQPWAKEDERIKMTQSYVLTLKGTQPLNIKEDSIRPEANEVVTGATSSVEVNLALETENGYENGKAECYYSTDNDNFVPMFETNSHTHSQRQDLTQGEYNYYFKCVDLGGNTALGQTNFKVFVDTFAPAVVRVLNDANRLKIITDEDATCYYSVNENTECNYEIGNNTVAQLMPHEIQDEKNEHFAVWNIKDNYYIKCKDENDKQPAPTQCSIVVKPEELSDEE